MLDTATLIDLHSQGHSDRSIGRILGLSSYAIWRRRQRAGLPPNHAPGWTTETARRCAIERNKHIERIAEQAGRRWPGAMTHKEADVLDILSLGAATADQIARALPCKSYTQALLVRLVRRGLLTAANLPRRVPGRPQVIYGLASGVEPGEASL